MRIGNFGPERRAPSVMLLAAAYLATATSVASALSLHVIGDDVITVMPGEVFTIDIGLENASQTVTAGVGVNVTGFTAAGATVVSGRSARHFLVQACTATACFGGLDTADNNFYDPDDLPSSAFYTNPGTESELGHPSGGESIRVIAGLSLVGVSGSGAIDPGIDGGFDEPSPRDATIDVVATVVGVHQFLIDGVYVSYPATGTGSIPIAATAIFTVHVVPEPTTAGLLGLGLAGLAGLGKRSRRGRRPLRIDA